MRGEEERQWAGLDERNLLAVLNLDLILFARAAVNDLEVCRFPRGPLLTNGLRILQGWTDWIIVLFFFLN